MARRKLTLDEFLDRIAADFRYQSPSPRRRLQGDEGMLMWRKGGLRAGVVVGPSVGGAFVVLGHASVQIEAVTEAVAVLRAIFAGEIIEVHAEGPSDAAVWMARADAPGQHISTYDRSKSSVEVPVFTSVTFRTWPPD